MKKYIVLLLLLIGTSSLIAQNSTAIFYDALYLKKAKDKSPIGKIILQDSIKQLLSQYYPGIPVNSINKKLVDSNVFFKDLFLNGAAGGASMYVKNSLSSIGGLNVTNFADGLAKFLVERTKQELSITFFEKFKDDLNGSDELKILFPATLKVLNTIDDEIYLFDAYLNTLREAFIKDMMNFYEDVQQFEKIPVYQIYFKQHLELYTLVSTSFYLINQYSKGIHPGKVLADFDTSKVKFKNEALQTNIRNSIAVAQLFSESLRSKETDRYWISEDSLGMLWKDTVLLDIYLGLIYQKGNGIKFISDASKPVSFQSILSTLKIKAQEFKDSIQPYQTFIQTLHADAVEVEEYLEIIKQKSKAERNYNDYYILYNASLDLVGDGLKFIDLPYVYLKEEEKQIKDTYENWIFVARSTGELYVDIRTKNYSSAILNTVAILDKVFPDNMNNAQLTGSLSKYNKKAEDFLKYNSVFSTEKVKAFIITNLGETAGNNIDTLTLFIFNKTTYKLRNSILKYGTFAAAIVQAQNSDEVKAAIEAIALPVGSASIKRNTAFNISLNAFVGLYAAGEARDAKNANNHHVNYWRVSSGITAPIGLAFSWGGLKCKDKRTKSGKTVGGKSLGFFIPLIDLGAVTAMRFKDSTASINPELKLQNIFAPGFYLHYGFGKCPISLLIGGQIGPSLRSISGQNTNIDNQLYTRVGATLTVDIPVLNLYTKTHPIRAKKK